MSDPRRLVLITGSRSLAKNPAHEAWARRKLRELLEPLDGADVVLSGKCPDSPDQWAAEIALERSVYLVEFALDGRRYHNGTDSGTWASDEDPKDPRWPLLRNDALCRAAARASAMGWDVAVEAFQNPASRTQGTKYTADKAASFNLVVHRHEPALVTGLPLVFFDCETAGLARADVMIEAAFIATDAKAGEVLNRWESKIALPPGAVVPDEVARINGYTPEGWANARTMGTVMDEFRRLLPERFTFVAHNASFDRGFLDRSLTSVEQPEPGWSGPMRDTKAMAARVLGKKVPNHRLATLCDYFAISNTGEHGAMADCERMLEVYRCLTRALDSHWED